MGANDVLPDLSWTHNSLCGLYEIDHPSHLIVSDVSASLWGHACMEDREFMQAKAPRGRHPFAIISPCTLHTEVSVWG